jgi:hypothetical protein
MANRVVSVLAVSTRFIFLGFEFTVYPGSYENKAKPAGEAGPSTRISGFAWRLKLADNKPCDRTRPGIENGFVFCRTVVNSAGHRCWVRSKRL